MGLEFAGWLHGDDHHSAQFWTTGYLFGRYYVLLLGGSPHRNWSDRGC